MLLVDVGKLQSFRKELESETNVKFARLVTICESIFGDCRIHGSHHVFKMPWAGDPRINLQKDGKKAKPYQVKQVIKAIDKVIAEGL